MTTSLVRCVAHLRDQWNQRAGIYLYDEQFVLPAGHRIERVRETYRLDDGSLHSVDIWTPVSPIPRQARP